MKQQIIKKLAERGIDSEEIQKNRLGSLSWIAKIAGGIFFAGMEIAVTAIKDEKTKAMLGEVLAMLEELANILTDAERKNIEQIEAYFSDKGRERLEEIFELIKNRIG